MNRLKPFICELEKKAGLSHTYKKRNRGSKKRDDQQEVPQKGKDFVFCFHSQGRRKKRRKQTSISNDDILEKIGVARHVCTNRLKGGNGSPKQKQTNKKKKRNKKENGPDSLIYFICVGSDTLSVFFPLANDQKFCLREDKTEESRHRYNFSILKFTLSGKITHRIFHDFFWDFASISLVFTTAL